MDAHIVSVLQKNMESLCERHYSKIEKEIFSWIAHEFCLGSNLLLLSHENGENSKLYNSGIFYEVEDYNTVNDFLAAHFSGKEFSNEDENGTPYYSLLLDEFNDRIFTLTDEWFSFIFDSFKNQNIFKEDISLEEFTKKFVYDSEIVIETALIDQLLFTPFQDALLIGLNNLPSDVLEEIDYSVFCKEILHIILKLKNELFITLTGKEIDPITFVFREDFFFLVDEFRTHEFIQNLPKDIEFLDEFILRNYIIAILKDEGSIIVREFTPLYVNVDGKDLRIHKMYGMTTDNEGYLFIDKHTLEQTYEGISTPNEKMIFSTFEQLEF